MVTTPTDTVTTNENNMNPQFVQQSVLDSLKCTNCHLYLSVFPIQRNSTGNVVICGRCMDQNNIPSDLTQDNLLEQALKFQRFPCINKESGCLEVLLPSKIVKHEAKCRFQKHKCPFNDCASRFKLDKIVSHFQEEHPVFLLNGRFEVDFVRTHNENYVMPFGDDVFVVNREGKSSEGMFSVTVKYLGVNPETEHYSYELILENGNKSINTTVKEKIGNKITLDSVTVSAALDNPVAIIASINILASKSQNSQKTNQSMDDDDDDDDLVDLSHLECPVCFHLFLPPVYQCQLGHSICEGCKAEVADCPSCHSSFGPTRNFLLEQLIRNTIYPCRHRTQGCRVRKLGKDIKSHEVTCSFGPFNCPLKDFENCNSVFMQNQLFDHIKNVHYESLLELDTINIPFNAGVNIDIEEGYIIQYNFNLFKLYFGYKSAEKKFLWAVQLVGPPEECAKYNFELEIVDNCGKNQRLYVKSSCGVLTDKNQIFQGDEGAFLFYDQISKFLKNYLTFRMYISHNQ